MLHWQLEWFLQLHLSEYRHNNSPSLSSNVSMDKICTRGSSGSSPWVTETQLGGARKVQPAVSKFPNAQNNWKSIKRLQIYFLLNVQATFFKCKIVEAAGSGPKTGAGGSRWVSDGTTVQLKLHFVLVGVGVASVRHPTEPGNSKTFS